MTELDKLFRFGTETASHLFERQGYLVPMWVGIGPSGAHIPLMLGDLMSNKDKAAEAVRAFLKKEKIVRYVSMLECWTYEGKDVPPEILEGQSLENNPDRREAIFILAEDKGGDTISGRYYILRPEHGKPKLSPLKVEPKMDRAEGRFVGMFD